jgi:hypothetical protein
MKESPPSTSGTPNSLSDGMRRSRMKTLSNGESGSSGVVKNPLVPRSARDADVSPLSLLYSPATVMLPRPPAKFIPAKPRTRYSAASPRSEMPYWPSSSSPENFRLVMTLIVPAIASDP